jgi:hypothetical protein
MEGFMKRLCLLVFAAAILLPSPATGDSILASDAGYAGVYRVGAANWTQFTAKLNTASGNQVFLAPNFEDLTLMLNYDALLLPARNQADTLSTLEITNVSAFVGTGRRVLLFGENDNWNAWNQQVISIAGGTYIAEPYNAFDGYSSSLVSHEITSGASTILGFWVGVASGGTQLYSTKNFVTLWGPSQNVLTILDENVVEDGYAGFGDDAQFTTNVANWLAGSPTPVPEPASILLLGSGVAALGAMRTRRS